MGGKELAGFFVRNVLDVAEVGIPTCLGEPVDETSSGVFARLVAALVFKTSGRLEESLRWVQFPYTPASIVSTPLFSRSYDLDNETTAS
jgi:hypothetical protein